MESINQVLKVARDLKHKANEKGDPKSKMISYLLSGIEFFEAACLMLESSKKSSCSKAEAQTFREKASRIFKETGNFYRQVSDMCHKSLEEINMTQPVDKKRVQSFTILLSSFYQLAAVCFFRRSRLCLSFRPKDVAKIRQGIKDKSLADSGFKSAVRYFDETCDFVTATFLLNSNDQIHFGDVERVNIHNVFEPSASEVRSFATTVTDKVY